MLGHQRKTAVACQGLEVDRIRCERGSMPMEPVSKIALVAQFSQEPQQSRSLSTYLRELSEAGYLPVVVSTSPSSEPLSFPHGLPDDAVVLRRPNTGYDFGSWAAVLHRYPSVRRSRVVLLTNDSLLGPFASIKEILDWAAEPGPDVKSLTTSTQVAYHAQSFFLAFNGGILEDDAWRLFFDSVKPLPTKEDVVMRYELGLSRFAFKNAYSVNAYVSPARAGIGGANPTVEGWQALMEAGVPFVKRTLFTVEGLESLAEAAQKYVLEKYQADVYDW